MPWTDWTEEEKVALRAKHGYPPDWEPKMPAPKWDERHRFLGNAFGVITGIIMIAVVVPAAIILLVALPAGGLATVSEWLFGDGFYVALGWLLLLFVILAGAVALTRND